MDYTHYARWVLADATLKTKICGDRCLSAKDPRRHLWSQACKEGHPELCSGKRKPTNGERGFVPCENPWHATKVILEKSASVE
jgi:hypothetical protein